MTIPLADAPDFWEAIAAKVAASAGDVVMGMAEAYRKHVQQITLRRYTHPPLEWTNSPPFTGTPAWVTGDLSRSIKDRLIYNTGTTAKSGVGPYIVYGKVQETGEPHEIWHRQAAWLHWQNFPPGGGLTDWFKKFVVTKPRPYLAPTTREMVTDGELSEAAAAAFEASVWG